MNTIHELMEKDTVSVESIKERLEWLEGELNYIHEADIPAFDAKYSGELKDLRKLVADVETCSGDTLISDSHISDYVENLVDELVGDNEALSSNNWPYSCYKLDLDQATKEYTMGLSSVLFNGATYWVR